MNGQRGIGYQKERIGPDGHRMDVVDVVVYSVLHRIIFNYGSFWYSGHF